MLQQASTHILKRTVQEYSPIPQILSHTFLQGFFAKTAGDFVIKYHKTFISAESASAQSSAISALAQSIRSLYNYSNEQGRTLKAFSEARDTHKSLTLY